MVKVDREWSPRPLPGVYPTKAPQTASTMPKGLTGWQCHVVSDAFSLDSQFTVMQLVGLQHLLRPV